MGSFNDITAAVQDFSEGTELFGESFSYTAPNGGATTSGLVGVFNQVEIDYQFEDFEVLDYQCHGAIKAPVAV